MKKLYFIICLSTLFIIGIITMIIILSQNTNSNLCSMDSNKFNITLANINLSNWELQLPINNSNNTDIAIIYPDDLVAGYFSEFFYKGSGGALAFWCPSYGVSTENSLNPRTELRELAVNGNWVLLGVHILKATCIVINLPIINGIVIGQIHGDAEDENPQLCKLIWRTDNILIAQVKSDIDPSGQEINLYLGSYCLGEQISYIFFLENLRLTITISSNNGETINTQTTTFKNDYWKGKTYYFKAGNYLQDHIYDDSGLVQFFNLTAEHY